MHSLRLGKYTAERQIRATASKPELESNMHHSQLGQELLLMDERQDRIEIQVSVLRRVQA